MFRVEGQAVGTCGFAAVRDLCVLDLRCYWVVVGMVSFVLDAILLGRFLFAGFIIGMGKR